MARRRIKPGDLYSFSYPATPVVTRDGVRTAFVITEISEDRHSYRSRICLLDTDSGTVKELTPGKLPAWGPDDRKLAFLKNGQLWVWEGSEQFRKVTALEGGIRNYVWSPAGDKIAAVVETGLPTPPGADGEGLYHITRLKYKADGRGYIYQKRPQLILIDINTGETRQLTDTVQGVESPAWSPDGKELAFITSESDPDGTWERTVMALDLAGEVTRSICTSTGAQNLSWSPDGQFLAFRAACGEYDPSVSFGLWVVNSRGGEPRELTAGFQPFVGNDRTLFDLGYGNVSQELIWSEDSQRLFFTAAEKGRSGVYEIKTDNGRITCLTEGTGAAVVFNFSYSPEREKIVAAAGNFQDPGNIWLLPEGRKITDLNGDLLAELAISRPEKLEWSGNDGTGVEGWVLKPPFFEEGEQYPAVLEIHGGPYRQFGMIYFYEMQVLAAAGYVVFFSNPRGSQGYGQEFARAIHRDWGNLDYQDLMAGMEKLLSLGFVDRENLGVTGGSYGGYMTNWIVTQTDIFKAAVTDRSVSNLHSFMGTSDIAISFGETDYGNIWNEEERERMLASSPISYVDQVRTPTLIIHQLEDQSCPLEQAEQFYVALKRLGVPTEMVLFPGACHELSRSGDPVQRTQRLKWMLYWFDKYLQGSNYDSRD